VPSPGWRPDPAWPPAPRGWQFFVEDDLNAGRLWAGTARSQTPPGRAAHDAAQLGTNSVVPPRRPPARAWYARKRVLLPLMVLVGIICFQAGQESAKPSGNDSVYLADAPPPGSGKAAGQDSSPTSTPGSPKAKRAAGPAVTKSPRPSRTKKAAAPEPARSKSAQPRSAQSQPTQSKPKRPKPAKTQASCDPHYTGACVPIASDVDCAGGGGNGPEYLSEPAQVAGDDIYGLDSDHDGLACENG